MSALFIVQRLEREKRRGTVELLIRVLSFGPVVEVRAPEEFVELVRKRVERQMECLGEQTPSCIS